jgi:hypothetical protein
VNVNPLQRWRAGHACSAGRARMDAAPVERLQAGCRWHAAPAERLGAAGVFR